MLGNLKQTLIRTKKYKLWHEAHIFKLVNDVFWTFAKTNLQLSESSVNIFFII